MHWLITGRRTGAFGEKLGLFMGRRAQPASGTGWKACATLEGISKPIFAAILNQPRELKLEKSPPFSKGGLKISVSNL